MTLAQLGAEVNRVDPIGGAADYRRWPVTTDGDSIYWAGLNKGKRSSAIDVRAAEGQRLVQRLIADAGILITNSVGRHWHSYRELTRFRPDLIHIEVSGRADGGTGVDYTVNAGIGFPLATGPVDLSTPVNHVLPAWDIACGLYTVIAVITALRHRESTGDGQRVSIPLENVALATAGNLGFLTEVMVNGVAREKYLMRFTTGKGSTWKSWVSDGETVAGDRRCTRLGWAECACATERVCASSENSTARRLDRGRRSTNGEWLRSKETDRTKARQSTRDGYCGEGV